MQKSSTGIKYPENSIIFEGRPINDSHIVSYNSKTDVLKISPRNDFTMPSNQAMGIGSHGEEGTSFGTGVLKDPFAGTLDLHYTCLLELHSHSYYWWYNFDWAGFEEKINEMTDMGLRMQNIDTYGHDEAYLYGGTWIGDGQGWTGAINYSDVSVFTNVVMAWPTGSTRYRPIDFAIHPWYNSSQLYGAVAIADNKGFGWILNADFTTFDSWIREQWDAGRRILNIEAYHHPGSGTPSYAGISEDGTYGQFVWFNMDWTTYEEKFNEHIGNGYRPIDYVEYGSNQSARFAGIWNSDGAGAAWAVNFTDLSEFQASVDKLVDGGYRPKTLTIFDADELMSLQPAGLEMPLNNFELEPNYPNPFNPATMFSFSLPIASYATLEIFNATGEKVATVVADNLPAGSYQYHWQARDNQGNVLPSGVYFYRLIAGDHTVLSRKMILMK